MAYRRRQGISRASTFKEEICEQPSSDLDENTSHAASAAPRSYSFTPSTSSSSSLAAQAIKASAARRDPSFSFSFDKSSLALQHNEHHRSKSMDAYNDVSKSGFWGVLAQKAKEILDDNNAVPQNDTVPSKLRSHSFNTFTPAGRAQEGRAILESKPSDLRPQLKLKGPFPEDINQAPGMWNPWQQSALSPNSQTTHETQLKASRDVAMATAAKAKLLLRELKTVKADLAFAKARSSQLEEENKLLRDREGREKGQSRADDDLIRLQLETLLAEKARLANENETYSRENRFLREIVEYHQLTMQDVVYLEEDDDEEGMEDMKELYPIDHTTTGTTPSPRLSMSSRHSSLGNGTVQTKDLFPVPQEDDEEEEDNDDKNTSEDEAPRTSSSSISISAPKDEHAK